MLSNLSCHVYLCHFLAILDPLFLNCILLVSASYIASRRRGRPKSNEEQVAQKRAPILNAAAFFLSNTHSNAITVDDLLKKAQISRPTFYRWFPNGIDQVVEQLIADANVALVESLQRVVAQHDAIEDKIREGISAYFQWCIDLGPVVYGIYREGFDEKSAAYKYRMQTRQFAVMLLQYYVQTINIQNIDLLSIETMVSWLESSAINLCREFPINTALMLSQARLTTTMFLSTLNSISPDWRERVAVYESLNLKK